MFISQRLLDLPFIRRNESLRTFIIAAWLGWQIESNWADPLLFGIYSIARPLASILILVVMYSVITNGATQQPIFAFIYLGNALYILVAHVISGVSWAVFEDRERYRTMKQIHTAPMDGYAYLMGRGVARLLIGSVSVLISIGFGVIVFKLSVTLENWPLVLASTALGVISLACLGLIVGSISMMMACHFDSLGDAISGALYLFTGAIFRVDVMSAVLRPIGFIFPVTYWLEIARRALLGSNASKFPTLAAYSDRQLMAILALMTIGLLIFSVYFYRWMLYQAKDRGLLDIETGY